MSNYQNENEIVIHSLGRSGSHAIKNWIASMFKEPVYCLNNCKPGDPYRTKSSYWRRVGQRPLKKFFVKMPRFLLSSEDEINPFRNIHKLCLMYSYEHRNIARSRNGDFVTDRDSFIGNSKNKYTILILRDVFNWLASRLLAPVAAHSARLSQYPEYIISKKQDWLKHASTISVKNYIAIKRLIRLWKVYADEFLGKTSYLPKGTIFISFNRWFYDKDYRIEIADLLGLENSDFSLDYTGSKSSFDGNKYSQGGARETKILERWKVFKDNSIYQGILDTYPEVRELSFEIFGKEIGT